MYREELRKADVDARPNLWPLLAVLSDDAYRQQTKVHDWLKDFDAEIHDWIGFEDEKCFARTYTWPDVIVIACRGTEFVHQVVDYAKTWSEKATDWGRGKVYAVTHTYYGHLRDKVVEFKDFLAKRQVIITGHSMGGMLAKVAASHMNSLGVNRVNVVTFGAPWGETNSFRNANGFGCSNIRFPNDGISALPFCVMPSTTKLYNRYFPQLLWLPQSFGRDYYLGIDAPEDSFNMNVYLRYRHQPTADGMFSMAALMQLASRARFFSTEDWAQYTDFGVLKDYMAEYTGPKRPNQSQNLPDVAHKLAYYIAGVSAYAARTPGRSLFVYENLPAGANAAELRQQGHLGRVHPNIFWNTDFWRQGQGFVNQPYGQVDGEAVGLQAGLDTFRDSAEGHRQMLDRIALQQGSAFWAEYLRTQGRL